jgi:H+-transporting ATPase
MLEKDGSAPANLMTYSEHILPADGFAQVFPEHKYLVVEVLRRLGHKTGMTGDGVNDAPALKRADVGVAVHGATDAARAAADIVLTRPGLSTIVDATIISRKVFQRIKNFLAYRIAATLQLISFFFVAVILMHPESYIPNKDSKDYPGDDIADEFPKFFKMPVLMLMLITLLNDGTLISIGYDNVKASPMPLAWNLPALYTIAASQAFIACISSLLLLDMALDSWNEGSIFHSLGLRGLEYGQVTTMMYFKVSVSDFLTLFSARTPDGPFYSVAPSRILLCAGAFATCLSTILASAWPESHPDHIDTIGLARVKPRLMPLYVWIYCFVMWLFEDAFKVLTIYTLKRFNIFGINDASSWPKILAAHEKKYADSYRKPLASGGGLV